MLRPPSGAQGGWEAEVSVAEKGDTFLLAGDEGLELLGEVSGLPAEVSVGEVGSRVVREGDPVPGLGLQGAGEKGELQVLYYGARGAFVTAEEEAARRAPLPKEGRDQVC